MKERDNLKALTTHPFDILEKNILILEYPISPVMSTGDFIKNQVGDIMLYGTAL